MEEYKFGRKSAQAKIVENCSSTTGIAQVFKDYFSKTCVPNNTDLHSVHKDEFFKKFEKYPIFNESNHLFTTEDIEVALSKLKRGKAVGLDDLSVEHLIYAHPCLIISIKILFNLMLLSGFVPEEFGTGLMIPILKESNADAAVCDNYRGVTISCVVSKLFENALLGKFGSFLSTDNLQFGFKKGVGCSDALHTVRSVVNHFTKNGCTVTVSALDISKAFDRVSHFALLSKMIAHNFPKQLIGVLLSWYTKCSVKVKWKDVISDSFQVHAGVRQGEFLAPCYLLST